MAVFWVVAPCGSLIALMMESSSTSETSVNFYQTTRRDNPEDSHLHTRRRENLKSHQHSLPSRKAKIHHCVKNVPLFAPVTVFIKPLYWLLAS
jgi:hypothetical protein